MSMRDRARTRQNAEQKGEGEAGREARGEDDRDGARRGGGQLNIGPGYPWTLGSDLLGPPGPTSRNNGIQR
jgi:hypothetical protein